jgi:hypothetical protein
MGRTLVGDTTRGKKDRAMNDSTDLNDTAEQPVGVLSPHAENFDGNCDQTAPFGLKAPSDPAGLIFGRGKRVRNDDKEDF